MAEPARSLDDQERNSVYDEPGTAPSDPKASLKVLEGGSKTSEPAHKNLSEAEENLDRIDQEGKEPEYEATVGRGYRPTHQNNQNKKGAFRWSGYSSRKKWLIGLGGGLLGGGIIALLIFILSMFRLDGYLSGINQRVFAAADNAVSKRVDNLFERYMVTKVLKMQTCGNSVTAGCKANYAKDGLASSLFSAWQDARIEEKLFQQYGLEVQSLKKPVNGQRFKIVDASGRFGNPGDELTIKDGKLALGKFEGGANIFGKEWSKFIKDETRWDQVLQRRSLRKYLVRKHGTKFWCFFACKTKDSIDNAKLSAKTKLQLKLIERTVYPFSQKYGLILECLATGNTDKCSPDNLEKNGIDRSLFTDQDLKDLKSISKGETTSFSQVLLEKLLVKIGMDEESAKITTGLVPIGGQIYLALTTVDMLNTTAKAIQNGTLSKIAANVNSDQYVEYYTSMREADDELKSGALHLDEAGALVSQFGDGNRPAEQSLVYQAYNTNSNPVASIFGTAMAASTPVPDTTGKTYRCANGQPIPRGMYVCPEKTLNKRTFKIEEYFKDAKGLTQVLSLYDTCYGIPTPIGCAGPQPSRDVHNLLTTVNWIINNTVGKAVSAIFSGLQLIPGASQLLSLATSWAGKLMTTLFNEIFPLPVKPDSPGREKYDALEAGGEIVASEFNQGGVTPDGQTYGLGGRLLSDQEQAAATTAYLDQQNYDTAHSSLLNRIAGRDNTDSLLTRFAMAMPSSLSQFSSSLGQMFTHPFHGFSFMMHPAYAGGNTAAINAFGVDRFGYTANDPVFNADPSIYTQQYCDQKQQEWQNSKTQNPVTGTDQYSKTDPCLLEQAAVEAASSVFTQDDSLDTGTAPDTTTVSTADNKQLAQQILSNNNISYPLDASSSNGSTKQVLQDLAAGKLAPVTCKDGSAQGVTSTTVDTNILQFILDLGNRTKIGVNALTDKCHVTESNHYQGRAVDLACGIDVNAADAVANKYGLSRNDESCTNPPPGTQPHWHYSTNGK